MEASALNYAHDSTRTSFGLATSVRSGVLSRVLQGGNLSGSLALLASFDDIIVIS